MAIANIRTGVGAEDAGTANIEIVDGAGNNRVVVANVGSVGGGTLPSSITLNGVAGTQIALGGGAPDTQQALSFIWYDTGLPSSAGTYEVACNGSGQHGMSVVSMSGAAQTTPIDIVSGVGYANSRSATISGDTGFLAFLADVHNGGTVTISNTTLINYPSGNNTDAHSYSVGSGSMLHTHSNFEYNAYVAFGIDPASSAPTISAGTPTGTVGGSVTAGFTSTAATGTARIVVDTAANLDAVTNTQVAAGQKENGTAAAYDSGNITVTDTTPEYTFNLPTGTWQIAAVHDGSTVLTWSITVDATGPTITAGPTVSNITASGFDVGATSNESGTARLLVTAYGAAQPSQAAFDASTETATVTANTPFSIHHTGQ